MSNEYYRPTYALKDKHGKAKPYNPTEVRLYGLKGQALTVGAGTFSEQTSTLDINIEVKAKEGVAKESAAELASLIGIGTEKSEQLVWLLSAASGGPNRLEAGIIFAYAYEGHCYDLPKPKVMLIPAKSKKAEDDDCGFDKKKEYQVWVVDKLESCIEIEVSQGFVEQLVLSANMPGNRSPSTYRATMAMSHRSGRLTDS